MVQVRVAGKALGTADEPEVELVFGNAEVAEQFVLKTLGIVNEIPWVHLEELRQQHASGIGEVGSRAALDLREIALADGFAELFLDQTGEFHLRDVAVEPPKGAFDFTQ